MQPQEQQTFTDISSKMNPQSQLNPTKHAMYYSSQSLPSGVYQEQLHQSHVIVEMPSQIPQPHQGNAPMMPPPLHQQTPMMSLPFTLPVTKTQFFARHIQPLENSNTRFKLVVHDDNLFMTYLGVVFLILFFPAACCLDLVNSLDACLMMCGCLLVYWIIVLPIILLISPFILLLAFWLEQETTVCMDDEKKELSIQVRRIFTDSIISSCQFGYSEIVKLTFERQKAWEKKVILENKHGQKFDLSVGLSEDEVKEELDYILKFFQVRGVELVEENQQQQQPSTTKKK
ncbi:hypothetical protein FDP41_006407 [Naegleria fowleri]|uniref:Uncharacterized protein n=1 Tax=Naegleria fowleri TaxID=5763 RepID=A0A6A5BL76_NAEFO|nr:uncharacterized protein FDP41_006407 [Naegleria fowleri]KAF0974375.1 hypothetical protein FDP41_006407 [Naegleria fowleri]CAG4714276.1 unnamed protein product [Naegleria fowleri]